MRDRWLITLYIEFFIANRYAIIIHFLSKDGSSTCFPLWLGPQCISNHGVIVIDIIQGNISNVYCFVALTLLKFNMVSWMKNHLCCLTEFLYSSIYTIP
uniref:Uncharacterized protein n=1 Tax=Lactuca sativa TaxID=4236 RepID=A0A9R1UHY0_LACSA|nr:hypothetical protein LSAT_V11C900473420 [Lactuca sativa]